MATTQNKLKIGKEIIEGMIFLGIKTERFSELKQAHGGLLGLYNFIAAELGA